MGQLSSWNSDTTCFIGTAEEACNYEQITGKQIYLNRLKIVNLEDWLENHNANTILAELENDVANLRKEYEEYNSKTNALRALLREKSIKLNEARLKCNAK